MVTPRYLKDSTSRANNIRVEASTGATARAMSARASQYYTPDDFASLQAALTAAAAGNVPLRLMPQTYTVASLDFPDGVIVVGRGATIAIDGTFNDTNAPVINIGAGANIEELAISTAAFATYRELVYAEDDVVIDNVEIIAASQTGAANGLVLTGQGQKIRYFKSVNYDRPIAIVNPSAVTQTEGGEIGFIDVKSYIRAFSATFASFTLGGIYARTRSANASKTPGHNGVLIAGCSDWDVGNCWIEGAGEHAFRIGGSPHANAVTKRYRVGNIYAMNCGGCAFKVNPTRLASAGVTETADDGVVGDVFVLDGGDGSVGGNEELLRITHVRGLRIGRAYSWLDGETASSEYGLLINDARDVQIAELGGEALNAGHVYIDGTSDVDGIDYFGGDVTGLRIGRLTGTSAGANAIGANTTFNFGDIRINCDGARGWTTNLFRLIAGTINAAVEITGSVSGSIAPVILGVTTTDNFLVDVAWANKRTIGRGATQRSTAVLEIDLPQTDIGNVVPNGLFLNNSRGTAASGALGSGIEFSRVGSSRRGAGIAAKQMTSDQKEVGLALYVQDVSTTANETLTLALELMHTGRMRTTALTAYADNAAAAAGGLGVGEIYWTAGGEVRRVV